MKFLHLLKIGEKWKSPYKKFFVVFRIKWYLGGGGQWGRRQFQTNNKFIFAQIQGYYLGISSSGKFNRSDYLSHCIFGDFQVQSGFIYLIGNSSEVYENNLTSFPRNKRPIIGNMYMSSVFCWMGKYRMIG